MRRIVVAFDFDGTITKADTFIRFVRYVKGDVSFIVGVLLFSPLLIAYKLGFYSNSAAKERLFSFFFKGMEKKQYITYCQNFAKDNRDVIRHDAIKCVRDYIHKANIYVYVVSASISDWVKPFFDKDELMVIGTEVEYDANECLTGHFLTPNCYGEEKVKRLLAMEPDRDSYFLISYGDSEGDKEIIQFSDRSYYQAFK